MNSLWMTHSKETLWRLLSAQKPCRSQPQSFQPIADQGNAWRKYGVCSPCCCTSPWVPVLGPFWRQNTGVEIWPRTPAPVIKHSRGLFCPRLCSLAWLMLCSNYKKLWCLTDVWKSQGILLILRFLPWLLIKSFSFALFVSDWSLFDLNML